MGGIEEKRKIGDLLKEKILTTLVEPSYYTDVNETIRGRKCWRVSGHVFESFSKILLAVSSVLSFAAGVYDDKILSFVAGTLSTTSLACFQFSLYSMRMHKKNSLELNQLLEKLNIETVPIFASMREERDEQIQQEVYEPSYMARQVDTPQKIAEVQIVSEPQIVTEAYKIDIPSEDEVLIAQRKQQLNEMVMAQEKLKKETEEKEHELIELIELRKQEEVKENIIEV
jgi:hypothetical protein